MIHAEEVGKAGGMRAWHAGERLDPGKAAHVGAMVLYRRR